MELVYFSLTNLGLRQYIRNVTVNLFMNVIKMMIILVHNLIIGVIEQQLMGNLVPRQITDTCGVIIAIILTILENNNKLTCWGFYFRFQIIASLHLNLAFLKNL